MSDFPDARKYDTGQTVSLTLRNGDTVEGEVYSVQYDEPDGDNPSASLRTNFRYTIHTGDKKTGDKRQIVKEKPGKIKTMNDKGEVVTKDGMISEVVGLEDILEPIYVTVRDSDLKG